MRLYYDNAYATSFEAHVLDTQDEGRRVYLDQTAFYPTSGGQLHDLGTLNGIAVLDVVDQDDGRIAHVLAGPLAGTTVTGEIDWGRRFDHMQQHSGQHLLSAVTPHLTVGVHLGLETSTVDLATERLDLAALEDRANAEVFRNGPVAVSYEDAETAQGLRKATERTGTIRIVTMEGLDRSACGGTHVRATGEIGPIWIRKTEKIRGNLRVHFLCGNRALRAMRAEREQLETALQGQTEAAKEADKRAQKLGLELAGYRGRELYGHGAEQVVGGPIDEASRALANAFLAQGPGTLLLVSQDPAAVMLASNLVHCGNTMKPLLAANGGRGGGSANLAQGSLPTAEALKAVVEALGLRAAGVGHQ